MSHLKKYGKPKVVTVCQIHEVKLIGRQILETLKLLHDKGLAHGIVQNLRAAHAVAQRFYMNEPHVTYG